MIFRRLYFRHFRESAVRFLRCLRLILNDKLIKFVITVGIFHEIYFVAPATKCFVSNTIKSSLLWFSLRDFAFLKHPRTIRSLNSCEFSGLLSPTRVNAEWIAHTVKYFIMALSTMSMSLSMISRVIIRRHNGINTDHLLKCFYSATISGFTFA